ncbi:PREDICTED: protein PFC0760c-like [Ceratosolen solmsi marchali]|uniref:Protein PFC0760c-like n=1 Tax=Ceratosolen solmsi marchali TaxID=326594 RepID=A0AAJ6YL00_9HYME|nr:PREDICTED: protein PFC0760c-like [Ceratosolen solmsi marchali]
MDIQIGDNCKYYKCRSLLACDTGGTVYETFKEFEKSNSTASLLKYKDNGKTDSNQPESIIYIIDADSELEKEKRSLVDLTTHLDDDEFNDYEIHSNMCYQPQNEVSQYTTCEDEIECLDLVEECIQSKNIVCAPNESADRHILQNLVDQILDNDDIFVIQDSGHYQHFNNSSSLIHSKDINDDIRKDGSLLDDIVCTQNDYQYFLTAAQNNSGLSDLAKLNRQEINRFEHDTSMKRGIVSSSKHTHKRKQIYNIKDDSFTELLNEDKDIFNKTMVSNIKTRKKKSRYNKENQRKKLQCQKRNPFANLKMNSILKGSKKPTIKRSKNHWQLSKRESTSSNDENFGENYCILSDDNFGKNNVNFNNDEDVLMYKRRSCQSDYCSSFHSKTDVLQEIGAIITLNSEFANADYLEYVQPRERIIESDMDKLLSPTIEVEFSEILKTCKIKQIIKDKKEQIDCNGNELDYYNVKQINNSKSILSPNEIAERDLFLKSAYAKKLGYENYFNTSNESIVNEILFDPSLAYNEINLDLNLLKHIEMYSKKNSLLDKSFTSVSCTLIESLNEFNRFGGFTEEICEDKDEDKNENEDENKDEDEDEDDDDDNDVDEEEEEQAGDEVEEELNLTDDNSDVTLDIEGSDNFSEVNTFEKRHDNLTLNGDLRKHNVIDDSVGQITNINEKKKSKSVKNIYRYKCFNCSAKFRTKRILKNHVSERHRGPYDTECEICHMKFRKSSAHKKHHPWCQKNVTHKCDICSKVYCYRASLIKHLKTHRKLM